MTFKELTPQEVNEVTACLVKKKYLPEGSKFTEGYRAYFQSHNQEDNSLTQENVGHLANESSRPLIAPREAYAYPAQIFDASLEERRRGERDLVTANVTNRTILAGAYTPHESGGRTLREQNLSVTTLADSRNPVTGDPKTEHKKAADILSCFAVTGG